MHHASGMVLATYSSTPATAMVKMHGVCGRAVHLMIACVAWHPASTFRFLHRRFSLLVSRQLRSRRVGMWKEGRGLFISTLPPSSAAKPRCCNTKQVRRRYTVVLASQYNLSAVCASASIKNKQHSMIGSSHLESLLILRLLFPSHAHTRFASCSLILW